MKARSVSVKQLIWSCLVVFAAVFLASTLASMVGRVTVARAVGELSGHVAPLQDKVAELGKAYVDQETGQRGFVLSGNPVTLDPYISGTATADRLVPEIRAGLSGDNQAVGLLDSVVSAAASWRTQAAEPQIAARRGVSQPPEQLERWALEGLELFDNLRAYLRELGARVDELGAGQLRRIDAAQHIANIIQISAAAVLIAVTIATVVSTHRLLTRPLKNLVDEVTTVADGQYDNPIHCTGPREFAELSVAVEQMRENLRASTIRVIESERRDEQGRIAAGLHDRLIQRVFALGLGLSSASARHHPDLKPFVDETDGIIADLREIIFNLSPVTPGLDRSVPLRTAVFDILEISSNALGFTPTLQMDGSIDQAPIQSDMSAAALAVIRESLNNTAQHARASAAKIHIAVTSTELRILVEDNGIGVSFGSSIGNGRRDIAARAREFGGRSEIRPGEPGPGTAVEWVVPLPSNDQGRQ